LGLIAALSAKCADPRRGLSSTSSGEQAVSANPLDEWDESGMTPLLWAIFRGDTEKVRALLAAGADPNRRSRTGDSPLWHAEDDFGLTDIAALLRQYGATEK
jgi:ankyrin repeat protein